MLQRRRVMLAEEHRTRLIGEIVKVLREECVPDEARAAGLILVGWLARRMPGEQPHALGVEEIRVACSVGVEGYATTASRDEGGRAPRHPTSGNGSRATSGLRPTQRNVGASHPSASPRQRAAIARPGQLIAGKTK